MVKEDSHFETSQISTRTDTGTIAEAHEGNLASIRTLFKAMHHAQYLESTKTNITVKKSHC
jgi:hypothetical protein